MVRQPNSEAVRVLTGHGWDLRLKDSDAQQGWAILLQRAMCDGQGHGRAQTVSCVGLRIGVQDQDDGLGMGPDTKTRTAMMALQSRPVFGQLSSRFPPFFACRVRVESSRRDMCFVPNLAD
jgi:hypothetical protein